MYLSGQKAIVTGGSRGLGLAIAHKLALLGANITLVARNASLLAKHQDELPRGEGQHHTTVVCDLSRPESLHSAFTSQVLKDATILVNCAGVTQNSLLLRTTVPDVSHMVNTNLVAPMVLSQLVLRSMMRAKAGHVINISSVLATKGVAGSSVYAATKGGLISFTRAMAVEMGPKHIQFNCILPGLVATDMGRTVADTGVYASPLHRRAITPADVADAVAYLLSSEVITGQCLTLDNGFSVS